MQRSQHKGERAGLRVTNYNVLVTFVVIMYIR